MAPCVRCVPLAVAVACPSFLSAPRLSLAQHGVEHAQSLTELSEKVDAQGRQLSQLGEQLQRIEGLLAAGSRGGGAGDADNSRIGGSEAQPDG